MNKQNQFQSPLTDWEDIRKTRQQLTSFIPAEGNLEVIFHLPNGETVTVPITKKEKVRLLSKEVRNYLAEEQLTKQADFN